MEIQAEIGQRLYYQCGTVILATEGHCDWEDATAATFDKVGVPYHKFKQADVAVRFPQLDASASSMLSLSPNRTLSWHIGRCGRGRAVQTRRWAGILRPGDDRRRREAPSRWKTAGGESDRRRDRGLDGGHVSAHRQADLADRRHQHSLYIDHGETRLDCPRSRAMG